MASPCFGNTRQGYPSGTGPNEVRMVAGRQKLFGEGLWSCAGRFQDRYGPGSAVSQDRQACATINLVLSFLYNVLGGV